MFLRFFFQWTDSAVTVPSVEGIEYTLFNRRFEYTLLDRKLGYTLYSRALEYTLRKHKAGK